jgi:hypothetical protein
MKNKMFVNKKNKSIANRTILLLLVIGLSPVTMLSQVIPDLTIIQTLNDFRPLDKVTVKCTGSGTISVKDAGGKEYVNMSLHSSIRKEKFWLQPDLILFL